MLRRSKNRLLANQHDNEPAANNAGGAASGLGDKEREWLAEIEQSQLALIRQADEAGLLKHD